MRGSRFLRTYRLFYDRYIQRYVEYLLGDYSFLCNVKRDNRNNFRRLQRPKKASENCERRKPVRRCGLRYNNDFRRYRLSFIRRADGFMASSVDNTYIKRVRMRFNRNVRGNNNAEKQINLNGGLKSPPLIIISFFRQKFPIPYGHRAFHLLLVRTFLDIDRFIVFLPEIFKIFFIFR